MIKQIKNIFYFPIASYFRFLAGIRLAIWKPQVIVVTGTSGKTTLLHLIQSQLKNIARYSHFANSSFGIPFDILGLRRKKLTLDEWLYLFIQAPFSVFKKFPKQKIYVVEADCDRPKEGKFLAKFLKPDITLWTNVSRAHTMNFNNVLVSHNPHPNPLPKGEGRGEGDQARMTPVRFSSVEQAIAYEFGYFLEHTISLAIVNGDSELIKKQARRSNASIKTITQASYSSSEGMHQTVLPESRSFSSRQARTINPEMTSDYKVFKDHTMFKINGKTYSINALLPKQASLSIQMTLILLDYLKIKPDPSFSKFKLPLGRASVFKGIKNTTLIDSTYNATPDGVKAILNMFGLYPSSNKWLVLGDMIELGDEEQEEHEKLADVINSMKLDKIILVGPRVSKYTYPKLKENGLYSSSQVRQMTDESRSLNDISSRQARTITNSSSNKLQTFLMPKEALDYLINNLKGGETILFKGARFLEGIIEHLLLNKRDVNRLCRRELIWQERRKKWGL